MAATSATAAASTVRIQRGPPRRWRAPASAGMAPAGSQRSAFSCRTRTVELIRQRLVERGFEETLNGAQRTTPPIAKLLDGKQEARLIAMRLGSPPKGYANWTLRLLARKVVELEIVDSICHETVRRTLQKTA